MSFLHAAHFVIGLLHAAEFAGPGPCVEHLLAHAEECCGVLRLLFGLEQYKRRFELASWASSLISSLRGRLTAQISGDALRSVVAAHAQEGRIERSRNGDPWSACLYMCYTVDQLPRCLPALLHLQGGRTDKASTVLQLALLMLGIANTDPSEGSPWFEACTVQKSFCQPVTEQRAPLAHVLVVAKVPRAGKCKTRLAASLSGSGFSTQACHTAAEAFARASIQDLVTRYGSFEWCRATWAFLSRLDDARQLRADFDEAEGVLRACDLHVPSIRLCAVSSAGLATSPQPRDSRHEAGTCPAHGWQCRQTRTQCKKMHDAPFALGSVLSWLVPHALFVAGCPFRSVVLLGMDSPTLPGHVVELAARRAAACGGAVALPSSDGGYVCLALGAAAVVACSHMCPGAGGSPRLRAGAAFDGVGRHQAWSTARALDHQLRCVLQTGLPVFLLNEEGEFAQVTTPSLGSIPTSGFVDVDELKDLLCIVDEALGGSAQHVARCLRSDPVLQAAIKV